METSLLSDMPLAPRTVNPTREGEIFFRREAYKDLLGFMEASWDLFQGVLRRGKAPAAVRAKDSEMRLLLAELLSNAWKYGNERESIGVRYRVFPGRVELILAYATRTPFKLESPEGHFGMVLIHELATRVHYDFGWPGGVVIFVEKAW